MKKLLSLIVCVLSISVLMSCASTKVTKVDAPEWYLKGAMKGPNGIYAIGRSNLSDPIMAEKAARVDGRAQLSQMIDSTVSYIAESSAKYDVDTRKSFKEKTRIISNQVLVGSEQVDKFEYKGEVSVLMFLPYEDMISKFKTEAEKQEDEKLKEFLTDLTKEQLESYFF